MNKEEFNKYWKKHYPESHLIGFELKNIYPNRWLRIHSLPESKRYAESEIEYQTILERQNTVISDLFGENSKIILSFGLYNTESNNNKSIELTEFGKYEKLKTIALHKVKPEEYQDECFYHVYIRNENWKRNSKDKLLRTIADDEFRALLISPKTNCIVSPYDGGIDIIVESQQKRNELKEKYKDWLSERKDEL